MKDTRCTTLALAGVFQAASLVKQIANTGSANSANVETSIESLFTFDASTPDLVYGSAAGVLSGLHTLEEQMLELNNSRDLELVRYAISLLSLERKLAKKPEMLDKISESLNKIESQLEFFSLTHENTYAKLGQLYKDTISTLGPKIMIQGDYPYLSNEKIASKVRALLLAGIRSAVLWKQCGGSRWQLLFGRKKYADNADKILFEM